MSIHVSVGTPTADSYVSAGFANSYFETVEINTGWTNLSVNSTGTLSATTRKENLLKQATREIDNYFRFNGNKYWTYPYGDPNYQALQFPRNYNFDDDGEVYIPDEVKYATCEQALWILERGGKKTTDEGVTIQRQMIGDEAMIYMRPHITKRVSYVGVPPWQA